MTGRFRFLLSVALPLLYLGLPLAIRFFSVSLPNIFADDSAESLRIRQEREIRRERMLRRIIAPPTTIRLGDHLSPTDSDNFLGGSDTYLLPEEMEYSDESFAEYQRWTAERDLLETPENRGFGVDYGTVKLRIYGRTNVRAAYGDSFYVSQEDRLDDTALATSNAVRRGFDLNMDMKINIRGKIGRRVTVDIDFDKNEKQAENTFKVQYTALRKKEFVQEVTFGNIDLVFPKSEFAVFEQRGKQTVGLESKMERGKLKFHTIATLTQGENAIDRFSGGFRNSTTLLPEYRFTARKYYQLEPFVFYGDGCNPPITAASWNRTSPSALATLTSKKDNAATFVPVPTDIDPGSLRIWQDDRDPRNDGALGAQSWPTISLRCQLTTCASLGNYHLLQEGKDYAFNPRTGRISFFRFIREDHKLFVQYTRNNGGSTCDPTAWQDGSAGIIETFIKWESTLQEDLNYNGTQDIVIIDDNRLNLDIYEVRGIYDLGSQVIQEAGFQLSVVNRGFETAGQLSQLGSYQIDFLQGIIMFNLREPFKQLKDPQGNFFLPDVAVQTIYTDRQPSFVAENSLTYLRSDFRHEVRNYRLSHTNILRNSVVVRINGAVLDNSKYYIDFNSGYFSFLNPNDPVIGTDTVIEITYEYSPFGASNQGFIVGLRSDYEANRSVKLGSTILYNGQFEPTVAPAPGQEPLSRLVVETDLSLNFDEERLTRLINTLPGADFDLVPAKMTAYAEYARSFYNPNTFGMALIDDMESSEDIIEVEVSDKDWVLASPPLKPATLIRFEQCARAPVFYRYYREPADIRRGLLPLASGARASPPYHQLAGPYNVAEGHLDSSQLNVSQAERQVSLVLDFDFSQAALPNDRYVAIVTRNFSPSGADFSNVTYLEFNARLIDAAALTGVKWYFDLGTVDEDSDGDGRLDTEDIGLDGIDGDTNGNGLQDAAEFWDAGERNFVLDSQRDGLRSEDRGYRFNPPGCPSAETIVGAGPDISGYPVTKGNGVLDTEDFDRDGILNSLSTTFEETTLTIPVSSAGAYTFEQGNSNLITPGDWQLFRVQIDHNRLTSEERKALRQVRSVRLYLQPSPGSENGRGKVLISGIRFGGSKWRQIQGENTTTRDIITDPQVFSVANIDNFSSKNEYRADSFLLKERSTWESLHGKKTNTEYARMREAALKLTYNFNGTGYTQMSARRNFINTMDLRFYDSIAVWVNYRNQPAQTDFIFRIGSSEKDFLEFSHPVSGGGWQKLVFRFSNPARTQGAINMKEVNMLTVGVRNLGSVAAGTIWVNDIYVQDPQIQTDDAWKVEGSLEIKKPVYTTAAGVPILSDIRMNYKQRYRGRRFASIGQTETNINETRTELQLSSQILPIWQARYNLLRIDSVADDEAVTLNINQQGSSFSDDHSTEHRLKFENPHLPQLTMGYQYRRFYSQRSQMLAENNPLLANNPRQQTILLNERTHAPSFMLQEDFPEILKSKVRYQLKAAARFFSRLEETSVPGMPALSLAPIYNSKGEKEQTEDTANSITIQMGDFTLNPSYSHRNIMLVNKNFTDNNNLQLIKGDFSMPWLDTPDTFRYRQRQTTWELQTVWQNLWIFTPNAGFSANYQENSFRDNMLTYQLPKYQRLKQPSTQAISRLSLPVNLQQAWPAFKLIRSFTPAFSREILLSENSLPFTTNASLYEDRYGVTRTLPPLADRTFNLIQYPFWHHFTSGGSRKRNNFARGREYVANLSLKPTPEPGYQAAFQNYDNSITLRENITTSTQWDLFTPLTLRTDTRLAQNAVRNNLMALPVHSANWGYSILQTWDLMRLLDFWFWADKQRHSSTLDLNYSFDRTMRITENLREDRFNPSVGLGFSWYDATGALSSLTFSLGWIIRLYDQENYLSPDGPKADQLIYNTIPTRPSSGIREQDIGHDYAVEYRTELPSLKQALQDLTGLVLRYNPRYTGRLSLNMNRYYYDIGQLLNRPTLDQYIFYQRFDMNLHTNVTGDLDLKLVWDTYRDPNTQNIRQEIFSFQVGFGARILF